LKTPARRTRIAGAGRRGGCRALGVSLIGVALLMLAGAARAQFAATLGIDSVNRYRGTGTDDVGPVLRASAMGDTAFGAYGGIAGLWRTRDAGLASADAMVGWSGRAESLPGLAALSPQWGWDLAAHRTHYGEGARYDFSELMAGVIAPEGALRTWYAPHYFGGRMHTLYTELNGSHALDDRWRVFGHLGWLHYGSSSTNQRRLGDRADTLVGIGHAIERWDLRLARDGIVAGHARDDLESRRRRAAWTLGASAAF
jgi:hypothetical protein